MKRRKVLQRSALIPAIGLPSAALSATTTIAEEDGGYPPRRAPSFSQSPIAVGCIFLLRDCA